MADIFISYSSKDRKYAETLAEKLRAAGGDLWIDQAGIGGATRWSTEIAGALESCKAFLLLLSSEAMASPNVIKEATLAAEWGKAIVPIDIEPVQLTKDFAYHLAGLQRTPLSDFDTIVQTLRRFKVEMKPVKTFQNASNGKPAPKTLRKTLAVLPFEDLSPTRDHEWFSDGLTEELIATLSKLSGLTVTSRTTIREYKNTKLGTKAISTELGVQYIVEGSVRKAGENLRIAAQLIDVETDSHLWSEVYKGTMADIFEVQESVGRQITEALRIALTGQEEEVISKRATNNVEAYELFLQGRDYFGRATRQAMLYAVELYEGALALDPSFALCRAALAGVLAQLYNIYDRSSSVLDRAEKEAEKAIATDSMLPEAHAKLSAVYLEQGKTEKALVSANKAIELDPKNFAGYYQLATVLDRTKHYKEAADASEKSLLYDPEDLQAHWYLILNYHKILDEENTRRASERAIPFYERHVRRHPDDQWRTINFVIILSFVERFEDARKTLDRLLENPDLDGRTYYNAACFYIDSLHDLPTGLSVLRRAIAGGFKNIEMIRTDTDLNPIREEEDFKQLIRELEEGLNSE